MDFQEGSVFEANGLLRSQDHENDCCCTPCKEGMVKRVADALDIYKKRIRILDANMKVMVDGIRRIADNAKEASEICTDISNKMDEVEQL